MDIKVFIHFKPNNEKKTSFERIKDGVTIGGLDTLSARNRGSVANRSLKGEPDIKTKVLSKPSQSRLMKRASQPQNTGWAKAQKAIDPGCRNCPKNQKTDTPAEGTYSCVSVGCWWAEKSIPYNKKIGGKIQVEVPKKQRQARTFRRTNSSNRKGERCVGRKKGNASDFNRASQARRA